MLVRSNVCLQYFSLDDLQYFSLEDLGLVSVFALYAPDLLDIAQNTSDIPFVFLGNYLCCLKKKKTNSKLHILTVRVCLSGSLLGMTYFKERVGDVCNLFEKSFRVKVFCFGVSDMG